MSEPPRKPRFMTEVTGPIKFVNEVTTKPTDVELHNWIMEVVDEEMKPLKIVGRALDTVRSRTGVEGECVPGVWATHDLRVSEMRHRDCGGYDVYSECSRCGERWVFHKCSPIGWQHEDTQGVVVEEIKLKFERFDEEEV